MLNMKYIEKAGRLTHLYDGLSDIVSHLPTGAARRSLEEEMFLIKKDLTMAVNNAVDNEYADYGYVFEY